MLVLWQPPHPAGIYSQYKVSIEPPDAMQSVLYVEKEGDPPGPAQAAFKGLVPGRAYSISVQTVFENEASLPTIRSYRTVPLRPSNLAIDEESITSNSFRINWEAPTIMSEFDEYEVSITNSLDRHYVARTNEPVMSFDFNKTLEPGKTYNVVVKTKSGNVTSWPAIINVTLKE